jgi:two-component system cell cycle sensor histidine kinase/response regulator CckA
VTFARKVLLMPALAGLSFVGVLAINEVTGRANARLIEAIETGYIPALELSRDVQATLLELQRALQDAVTASDVEGLQRADELSRQLLDSLDRRRANPVFRPGEIESLHATFRTYYEGARATTRRMIDGDRGDSLDPALERMATEYRGLRDRLEEFTGRQRTEMMVALAQARENHRRSVGMMTLGLVLALIGVALVSRVLIRSTLGALRGAVEAAAALSGKELGTGRPRQADEIAALLGSLYEMVAALAEGEARLNEAQRLAHVGSWEWDEPSSHTTWSDEMRRIFGLTGTPPGSIDEYLALVHAADRDWVAAVLERGMAAGQPFNFQCRIVRPDGGVRIVLFHNEVRVDGAGTVVGLRGVTRDVTESETTAAALRESEERYRMLFENNPQPMWVYEVPSLRFLAVNDSAVRHYGYGRDEFLSMTIADIRPEEDRASLAKSVANGPQGLEKSGIWRHRRKDGTLLDVEITSHGVPFGARNARLVLANDVTERSRLEEQLRQAQKLEAIGRLAGGVAHDFNNILNIIMGYAEIVMRRLPFGDPLASKIAEILKAADRAAGLTRQLLAFSRRQVLQPRVLNLNAVVSEMDKMLRPLIGESVALTMRLQEPLGAVKADPGQMEQVIMNLAVNACDAMAEGGTLLLETRDVELDAAYVRLHPGASVGPHVMLAVADTGHGMDPETLARIFEPFFTTKAQGQGTGLGLPTVYGIVEQSGGSVDVESAKGRGTTFRVYLPRAAGQALPEKPTAPAPLQGGCETVLLVEDEPALRGMIRETLEQAGYRVLEGVAPSHALALAASHDGAIDLMLTDVVMPEMSGRQLADRLKSVQPATPVVYMSGYIDDAMGRHGSLEEGTHFLQKPFTPQILLRKLREVLRPD